MTIDHYIETKLSRGHTISSNQSNFCNNSMSTHLIVPGGNVSRAGSVREQQSCRRMLPLRSGSFRNQAELEREKQLHGNSTSEGKEEEQSDTTFDALFYLSAKANKHRRRSSLPASSPNLLSLSNEDISQTRETKNPTLRRVRSFKTTTKGVVNRGDSVRKKAGREGVEDKSKYAYTPSQHHSRHIPLEVKIENLSENPPISYYKVVVLGAPGVGKTSITQQFMTSEYVAFENSVDQGENIVTVQLNGEESTLEFVDLQESEVNLEAVQADAYIIIFSIAHPDTFDTAVDLICELRMDLGTDRTVIMVGNKQDLVRKRKVKTCEAQDVATRYDGKYIEVSAGLNHNIDELLVGILGSIRFKLNPSLLDPVLRVEPSTSKFSIKGPINFFSRLFRRMSSRSKRGRRRLHTVT